MNKKIFYLPLIIAVFCLLPYNTLSQVNNKSQLSIKQIMQDDWIGTSPSNLRWSKDGKTVFFSWKQPSDEKSNNYMTSFKEGIPVKAEPDDMDNIYSLPGGVYNINKTMRVYVSGGDLFLHKIKSGDTLQVTSTVERVGSPYFSTDGGKIIYTVGNNIFTWDIKTGQTVQKTNFVSDVKDQANSQTGLMGQFGQYNRVSSQRKQQEKRNAQDEWLYQQQFFLFDEYSQEGSGSSQRSGRSFRRPQREITTGNHPRRIDTEGKTIQSVNISPDLRYVTYTVYEGNTNERARSTEMPKYVTRSGYTEIQTTRSKVGGPSVNRTTLMIYDTRTDTIYELRTAEIPGIRDLPDYIKDYPDRKIEDPEERVVRVSGIIWSNDGKYPVVNITSADNKDRWIMFLDLKTGIPKLLDRQRDEAWIGGPGIRTIGWMPDNKRIWFQSEETGYSHLYTLDVETGEKKALTSGKFEVYGPRMSKDKKFWYFSSNQVHPGEKHFYKMLLNGGKPEQITSMEGSNQVYMSPDEKNLAIIFSYANKPPELFLAENKAGKSARKVTSSLTDEFKAYNWRAPEVLSFKAEDGVDVYARLYRPEKPEINGPAVIFVHGAGYLQNAHKWWSSYYHEYMFHNFLVDNGYTVLDIDYRGSAGYGRDCRTGIYRHMGGKDLSDQVDGVKMLVEKYNVDPKRVGIYGGSYGGFITLMALFTEPDVFTAGAALRSVTDWAHYNHGYTANILNTAVEDSIAYARSSPIYFAEGFKGHLVMLHGMQDSNVHFQDVVRLSQRLIELGKNNWELSVFPLEGHGFSRPTSWTDEYKRIYKLFETTIK